MICCPRPPYAATVASETAVIVNAFTLSQANTRSLGAVAPELCFDSGVVKATGTLDADAAACPGAR